MSDAWREVVAEWKGEDSFLGRNASGGSVQIGTIGDQPGVGPMEMLLLGVAGCTGMDITLILRKQRQPLHDFKVRVRGKRADTYPRIYTDIQIIYLLWGEDLDPKAVEQAIQLSEEKYCSASIMLRASAQIKSSYYILPPGVPEPVVPVE